jgi:hypothetical protein
MTHLDDCLYLKLLSENNSTNILWRDLCLFHNLVYCEKCDCTCQKKEYRVIMPDFEIKDKE